MLTLKEKAGIQSILENLTTKDLLTVASTTTNGLIIPESRNEAVEAVLLYTNDALSFLERKKITKAVLLQYLKGENVVLPLTGMKLDLVRTCLNHWHSDNGKQFIGDSYTEPVKKNNDNPVTHTFQEPVAFNSKLHEMGLKFTNWYFPMLNNLNGFGVQHFWPDCKLKMNIKRGSEVDPGNEVFGAHGVVSYLSDLINKEKLLFDPNLATENGVVCSEESHGLIKIIAKGIVHKPPISVGLFDQGFGLVKDPSSCDTWKIKYTELLMHVQDGYVSYLGENIPEERMLCDFV